jgi:hypothetical protein
MENPHGILRKLGASDLWGHRSSSRSVGKFISPRGLVSGGSKMIIWYITIVLWCIILDHIRYITYIYTIIWYYIIWYITYITIVSMGFAKQLLTRGPQGVQVVVFLRVMVHCDGWFAERNQSWDRLIGGLEHFVFPYIGNRWIVTPTDELIFFRVGQPPTSRGQPTAAKPHRTGEYR